MSDNASCFNYIDVLHGYAGLNMFLGLVSCILGCLVLLVLYLLDKHLFYYQRLIMYLNVSVVLRGFVSIFSFSVFINDESVQPVYCTINGFLFNWIILTQLIIIWWISIEVFRLSYKTECIQLGNSVSKIEMLCLAIAFFVPPNILWFLALPQINFYRLDGLVLCDIQTIIPCDEFFDDGLVAFVIYRVIPIFLSLVVLHVLLAITIVKVRREMQRIKAGNQSPQQQEMAYLKYKVLQLQFYPFLYVLFSVLNVSFFIVKDFLHTRRNVSATFVFYFLYIVVINFRGIAVSLVFTLDNDTRSRLTKAVKAAFLQRKYRTESTNWDHRDSYMETYNAASLYVSYGDSLDAKELRATNRLYVV